MTVATAGCTRMVLVGAGTTAVPADNKVSMALSLRTEFYGVNN
jgi:hypothetical protein